LGWGRFGGCWGVVFRFGEGACGGGVGGVGGFGDEFDDDVGKLDPVALAGHFCARGGAPVQACQGDFGQILDREGLGVEQAEDALLGLDAGSLEAEVGVWGRAQRERGVGT
jgi:hypothetical protein